MKAAQINSYGSEDVLQLSADAPKPVAGAGEVLVEVYAAGVNPFDIKVREGKLQEVKQLQFPATLGGDLAGVVAGVAEGVTEFKIGDEVYGQANALGGQGSYAEFTTLKAEALAPKPNSLDFINAAGAPLVGVSAYQALVDHAGLKKGQKILIHGGAGGIGTFAIQLAKHLGAYVATTASAGDAEYVKNLGADEVIDYKTQAFEKLIKDYDVVYDTVGGETFVRSHEVLKQGGILVTMAGKPDDELAKQYSIKVIGQVTKVIKRPNEKILRPR